MNSITAHLEISVPVQYYWEPSEGNRGLLVLHGYSDHSRSVRKRLLGLEPVQGYSVLSPNAVFPAPAKKGDEFKAAYSWYFRDPKTGEQMIPPEFAAKALLKLLHKLGTQHLEWTILGFSQGGFFAPFLVREGLNAKKIIAVGAGYRPEYYQDLPPVDVYALHGDRDEDVPYALAKGSFEGIQKMGYGKEFRTMSGVKHTANEEGRQWIRSILEAK